ncbi:formate dehydrogenase accessory sulfurtransferase FdhD [Montanilutibacter psychrotolerans]|uniref:Sulfur carrier protein FdhD n=1 Tax=Montanilutibacter psychrotolerans TaxID=1327343 RepID=A0A3M8SPS6_9GAMM|nr:formate dehydrogenase accessory sulfurtransferase FdhD [Lysobacter psychrotolerans]RNF82685.1 formate dehydrogenase accessory sulfurtransferase FdhD [Lysobacter psychrotolerans]
MRTDPDDRNDTSRALAGVQAQRVRADGAPVQRGNDDEVVIEAPVALLYNGSAFAVMMASPNHLDDFALGFALSEGIVANAAEFRLVDRVDSADGITLHAAIPQQRHDALLQRRRSLAGASGCGLCGIESLRDALRPVPQVACEQRPELATITTALRELAQCQPINARSGGVHAAAFLPLPARATGTARVGADDGARIASTLVVREDVGRHNALDKLIGALARSAPPGDPAAGVLLVTSRASYEIVHKAAVAGFGIVVAISAPTDLAIRTAQAAGITLAAFARGDGLNIYSHPQRIAGVPPGAPSGTSPDAS